MDNSSVCGADLELQLIRPDYFISVKPVFIDNKP